MNNLEIVMNLSTLSIHEVIVHEPMEKDLDESVSIADDLLEEPVASWYQMDMFEDLDIPFVL